MFVQAFITWLHAVDVGGQHNLEEGQGLIEYAMIMIFVAVLVVALLTVLGPTVANMFENIYSSMKGAGA